MVCIYCGSETDVQNSRSKARTPSVWRRRACKACVAQFTTIELPDYSKALVVSSPGSKKLAPFTRDKLFLSIYKSLGHRPDALDSSTALTTTIIGRLLTKNKPFQGSALENKKDVLIYVHNIAVISYEVLRRFDPSAAAIYKTYHKEALRD